MSTSDLPDVVPDRRRSNGAASREETRRRLLLAADQLFRDRGYQATTVTAIAERAGVSVQTLYLAWGSKRALLRAAGAAAATAADIPTPPGQWRDTIRAELADDVGPDPGAAAYLHAVSALFVRVAERSAPYRRMVAGALSAEPELAADAAATLAERRVTMTEVAAGLPREDLRPELGPAEIADTLWTLASPEVYDLLTTQGGHTPDQVTAWLARTLVNALCAS